MATYANLYVDQGTDYETEIVVFDANSDPIDLTYMDLSGQIRRTHSSETAYDFVITKSDPSKGEIKIGLPDETTSAMKVGRYVYDIFASDPLSDNTFKIIEGILEIVPSVTR